MRDKLSLLAILVFATAIRLLWINRVPSAISHDELDYFLGGKYLAFTASDLTGTWKWWTLVPMQTGTFTAELAHFYFLPAAFFLGNSLLVAKTTPIIFSVLTSLFVFALMYRLSKQNKTLSLLAALMIAINPWNFILSRTGYEVTFALFWYLASIVAYLYIDEAGTMKKRNIWILIGSLLSLFLGYFSYHGFKFLAPFIAVSVLWGKYFLEPKARLTRLSLLYKLCYGLLPLGLLLFSLTHYSVYGNRTGEVGILNLDKYANMVNTQRRLSITTKITPIVFNKYSQYIKDETTAYLALFSPVRLFLATSDIFNLDFPNHGYFYFVEIISIGIGIVTALKNKRLNILFMLLIMAPVPSLVHNGVSYTIRSSFAMIPLTCFSALGFYTILTKSRKIFYLLTGLLVVSVGYFLYLYFYSYGVLSADQYMLDQRLLSSYLSRSINQSPTTVISDSPYHVFRDYIYYGDILNRDNASSFQNQFQLGLYNNYHYDNLLVTADCEYVNNPPKGQIIVNKAFYIGCIEKIKSYEPDFVPKLESIPAITIGSPLDSRAYFRVFNPSICLEDRAGGFINITQFKQLGIEQLSNQDFCSTWVF